MHIIYSDENDRLTPEIWSMMQQALDKTAEFEIGEELSALGIDAEDADAEVGVTIVGDDEILELNREYREKDSVTDVLSFPQFEDAAAIAEDIARDSDGASTLIGDVVICYDQALRQAEEYGTGKTREILYLFVHSLMHLFGYDHENEEDRALMRSSEERVLDAIGVSR
jgi:probable rRNA maturation factor